MAAATAALGLSTVALAQGGEDKAQDGGVKGSRAASATASAYARDDDGNRSGYVKVSGGGSKRGDGTAASASTSGGSGRARASSAQSDVSIFGDLVTATSVSVTAEARSGSTTTGGSVRGLVIDGSRKGSVSGRRSFRMGGYGRLVVLGDSGRGITGLSAELTRDYEGYPAGSTVKVAYAAASARDAVAAPEPKPEPKPKEPKPEEPESKPDEPAKDEEPDRPARRKAPRTPTLATSKGFVFPVAGKHTFSNDWGAPRQNTGSHEGNDIFATAGTPAVAVCDGSLHRVGTNTVPGNRLWVKCDKGGDAFFYAHLSAFASDARSGADVKAGQVIGFTGSTGDAEQTPPHVHFEIHPGGWGNPPVNPYPFLRAWESQRDVPDAAWVQANAASAGQQPGTLVVVRDFLDG